MQSHSKNPLIAVINRVVASVLTIGLAAMTTGCETARDYSLTRKLWSPDADFEGRVHHPASDAEVKIFESTNPPDLLIQYNETKDNWKTTQRRAFFLLENQNRTGANRKPRFVSPDTAAKLSPIPLRTAAESPASPSEPVPLYAVLNATQNQLTLHGEHWDRGPYSLPQYSTSYGTTTTRVALTPLAVTGDVVMVGLAAGFVGGILWLAAKSSHGLDVSCR